MKDEYLKVYQQRIEEIKTLDVSPEEKRKLAADAKTEILEQYKNSYIEEEKNVAKASEVKPEQPVVNEPLQSNETDPIGNLLNKFEERDDRGEVGIELVDIQSNHTMSDEPEVLDPESLFETMNLGDLLESLGIDDEDDSTELSTSELPSAELGDIFMDTNELFGGLFDDEDDEQIPNLLEEFDLNSETQPLDKTEVFNSLVNNQVTGSGNNLGVVEEKVILDNKSSVKVSLEAEVDEIEELTQGVITDSESSDIDELLDEKKLDAESVEELKELEKERERAQKLGIIEMALLVVLIILVIVVVNLYINIGV